MPRYVNIFRDKDGTRFISEDWKTRAEAETFPIMDRELVIETVRLLSKDEDLKLSDSLNREDNIAQVKRLLGDREGFPGVVMLEFDSHPNVRQYQVFCSWMSRWHIDHINCSVDISYEDDGRGLDRQLRIVVRKKYKKSVHSLVKVLNNEELNNFTSSIDIKRMAEDALMKMDAENNKEK